MSSTVLVLICILGWGIGSFFCKTANSAMHPIMVIAIGSILHTLMTPLLFGIFKVNYTINTTGVVYSILCGIMMGIGSIAYFYALQKNDAGSTTFITALYPGVTILLSFLFMGENLSWRKMGGILCAFASFYFFSAKK